MSRTLSNVLDITPQLNKRWTIIIQVLENGHVQRSQNDVAYKRLIFTDTQGTKVGAVMYDSAIKLFSKLLTQYKRYYISNAVVRRTDAVYRVSSYAYSWLLNTKTLVEELDEQLSPPNLIMHQPEKQVSGTASNVANPSTISLPANQPAETTESESVVKPAADKGKELFSPTTRVVLEEISSKFGSKTVKRSLSFSNKDPDGETAAHILAIKKEVGDQDMKGSPTKKTKDSKSSKDP